MEGGLSESALLRGKGKSRAGGMGRMSGCGASSEALWAEEGDFILKDYGMIVTVVCCHCSGNIVDQGQNPSRHGACGSTDVEIEIGSSMLVYLSFELRREERGK